MKTTRVVRYLLLLAIGLLTLLSPWLALAQEESLELAATFPRIESTTPGASFKFTVGLKYRGTQAQTFDLTVTEPPGWTTYITSNDESTRIAAMKLEPNRFLPDNIKVIATPPNGIPTEAGAYRITLTASSSTLTKSLELTAVVTPTYSLDLFLEARRFSYQATVGEDNLFSLTVHNTGSGTITNIMLSAEKPSGLDIEFSPARIDSLAPGRSEVVEVSMKPDENIALASYRVNFIAEATQTRRAATFTISVEKRVGDWVWMGAIVGLIVVIGFSVLFVRLNRQSKSS